MKQVTHTQQDVIQSLATQLISLALKYHVIPWRNPIRHDAENCGLPLDIATQEPFDPVSTVLLQIAEQRQNYTARWWGTGDIWKELGGLACHNEQSSWIAVPDKEDAYVYNIAQVDGDDVDQFRPIDCALIDAEEIGLGPLQQAVEKIGGGKSNIVSSNTSGLLYELAMWADLNLCKEAEPPLRAMAKQICAGWLATELRVSFLCQPCAEDVIKIWLEKMHHDPSWIFRVCERARRMMELVLAI